jgi:hypothetical protein
MSKVERKDYQLHLYKAGRRSKLVKTETQVNNNSWTSYTVEETGQLVCETKNHNEFWIGA